MSLTLSANEAHLIVETSRCLLAPFDHADSVAWRRAALRLLKRLAGADSATFTLPDADGPWIFSDEHDPATLSRFPELQPPGTHDGTTILERVVGDRVATIESAYRRPDHVYFRSAYFHEYMRPAGAESLVSTLSPFDGADGPIDPGRIAGVQLMRNHRSRSSLGERERQLVLLLYPAIVAGVDAWRRLAAHRGALLDSLDGLGSALLVLDAGGRRVHETPGLTALFAADPERATLRQAMLRAAAHSVPDALVQDVRTRAARYRIVVSRYRDAASVAVTSGPSTLLLVALDRLTPIPRSDAELRADFGLTAAEVRVARLLALGKRNADIAEVLQVTEHTARRHTEHVFVKLGIRSRAGTAARLQR
jgi:DNA-binding CsgD family transcriptional regulator